MILPEKKNIYKMIIELDEEKIEKNNEYSLESIFSSIKKLFANMSIMTIKNGIYTSPKYENIISPISLLETESWFIDNVKKWILIYPNGNEEDLLDE